MTTTTAPASATLPLPRPEQDEMAGRLASHLVASALVRKTVQDPVPFPVWWKVTDALRASVLDTPASAIAEVDEAVAGLLDAVGTPAPARDPGVFISQGNAERELRLAQLLLARLVFAHTPTPPTLLHVRLVRLRRALAAAALR